VLADGCSSSSVSKNCSPAEKKSSRKKLRAMETEMASRRPAARPGRRKRQDVGGIKVVTRKLDGVDSAHDCARWPIGCARSTVRRWVALGSDPRRRQRWLWLVASDPRLDVQKSKPATIIKNIAPIVGGTGGGRPDLAPGRRPATRRSSTRRWPEGRSASLVQ